MHKAERNPKLTDMSKQKFHIWGRGNNPFTLRAAGKFTAISQEKCRSSGESVEESYEQVRGLKNMTREEEQYLFILKENKDCGETWLQPSNMQKAVAKREVIISTVDKAKNNGLKLPASTSNLDTKTYSVTVKIVRNKLSQEFAKLLCQQL